MIARIGKTYSFAAAHQLINHDGKCARPHGHTYSVTFEVVGEVSTEPGAPDEGMVLDYAVLDRIWKEYLEPYLDHRDLNESIGDDCWPTTAEKIAAWCGQAMEDHLGPGRLTAIEVCESPKTFARIEFCGPDPPGGG